MTTVALTPKKNALDPANGALTAREAHIWAETVKIWKNAEDARAFLEAPHSLLGGKTPRLLMAESETGARLVEDLLGRLRHGSAA